MSIYKEIDVIDGARSLEHAMDQAIEKAQKMDNPGSKDKEPNLHLTKVEFVTLTAMINYRGNEFIYTFKATFEEL